MHVVAPSPSISPSMSWKAMGANANSDDIVGMIHNLCHNKYKKKTTFANPISCFHSNYLTMKQGFPVT